MIYGLLKMLTNPHVSRIYIYFWTGQERNIVQQT